MAPCRLARWHGAVRFVVDLKFFSRKKVKSDKSSYSIEELAKALDSLPNFENASLELFKIHEGI